MLQEGKRRKFAFLLGSNSGFLGGPKETIESTHAHSAQKNSPQSSKAQETPCDASDTAQLTNEVPGEVCAF